MSEILIPVCGRSKDSLCVDDASGSRDVSEGHNKTDCLEYGTGEKFFVKSMDSDSVERATDSYKILEELGVDVPEVYSDTDEGFMAVESLGDEYRSLRQGFFKGEIGREDVDGEELLMAVTYKFVVSDFDVYPENLLVERYSGKVFPVDYEFAGCSELSDFEQATVSLERMLRKDLSLERVYSMAKYLTGGMSPDELEELYEKELDVSPDISEDYTRFLRQANDFFEG